MTQGKQNLREFGGSFQTADQQKEMMKAVERRHESFVDVVQRQTRESEMARDGGPKKELDMIEPDAGGVSLTQEDITGGARPSAPEPQPETHSHSAEDSDYKTTNEYGDVICKHCKSVLSSDKPEGYIDIKDDELTTYMFGGRIIRTFKVGKVEFVIQSLLQNEVDDVSFRTSQDMENGVLSLESDYRTRHSLYRLVYALDTMQNNKITPDPPKGATVSDLETWFTKKFQTISAYSHQFIVMLSEKQALLENSLNFAINDQVRLKN